MFPHGFDGVQITINGDEKIVVRESKLYKTGKSGVNDLINDIKTCQLKII